MKNLYRLEELVIMLQNSNNTEHFTKIALDASECKGKLREQFSSEITEIGTKPGMFSTIMIVKSVKLVAGDLKLSRSFI